MRLRDEFHRVLYKIVSAGDSFKPRAKKRWSWLELLAFIARPWLDLQAGQLWQSLRLRRGLT